MKSALVKFGKDFKFAFYVITHPFRGFWNLKHDKMGNAWVATSLFALLVLVNVLYMQFAGFSFNFMSVIPEEISILQEIMNVGIVVTLWCVANWGLTTLFNGEGSMKDIYIYTGYSMLPMILITLLRLLLSNILTIDEVAIMSALVSLGTLWTGFLLYTGTMTTHQYGALRTFFILLFVCVFFLIIGFVAVLFFFLLDTLIKFVYTIYREISFRY